MKLHLGARARGFGRLASRLLCARMRPRGRGAKRRAGDGRRVRAFPVVQQTREGFPVAVQPMGRRVPGVEPPGLVPRARPGQRAHQIRRDHRMRRRQLQGFLVVRPRPRMVALDGGRHAEAVGHPGFGPRALGRFGSGGEMDLRPGRVSLAETRPAGAEQRLGLGGRRHGPFVRLGEELFGKGEVVRLQRQVGAPEPGLRRVREMAGELHVQPFRRLDLAGIGGCRRHPEAAVQLSLFRWPESALFLHRQTAAGAEGQGEPGGRRRQTRHPRQPLDLRCRPDRAQFPGVLCRRGRAAPRTRTRAVSFVSAPLPSVAADPPSW